MSRNDWIKTTARMLGYTVTISPNPPTLYAQITGPKGELVGMGDIGLGLGHPLVIRHIHMYYGIDCDFTYRRYLEGLIASKNKGSENRR